VKFSKSGVPKKIKRAKEAGYTTFLVSQEQMLEDVIGINIYHVQDIKEAWSIANQA
jgi:hypothetical protein